MPSGSPRTPRVTATDVAKRLGVSASAVYSAMGDGYGVSARRKASILATAKEMGYSPYAVRVMARTDEEPMKNPLGLDLSHHQAEPISFNALRRDAGLDFVGLKATEGAAMTDDTFRDRRARAHKVGFPLVMPYHFLRADVDVKLQAARFVRALSALVPNERPVIDLEGEAWAKVDDPAKMVRDFVFHAKRGLNCAAKDFILYAPVGQMRPIFGDSLGTLTFMDLWVARYPAIAPSLTAPNPGDVSPWDRWSCWQYTDKGRVAGVDAPVDLNVWNGRLPL